MQYFIDSYLLVACVILLGVAALNYFRFRDPLYPGFLQAIIWAMMTGLLTLSGDWFHPIAPSVTAMVVAGVIAFSSGAYYASYRFIPTKQLFPAISLGTRAWPLHAFLFASIAGLPWYLSIAWRLGTSGPTDDFFFNLRWAATNEIDGFGLSAYFSTFSYALVCLYVIFGGGTNRALVWIAASTASIYAAFSSGRTSIVLLAVSTLGVLAISRRLHWSRAAGAFAATAIFAFVAVAYATGKGVRTDETFSNNLDTLFDSFVTYLLSAVPAFNQLVMYDKAPGFGEYTFRFFYAVAERLGASVTAVPLVQQYVYVPVATNVYTYLQPYYLDFRAFGVVVFPFIFGYIHSYSYVRASSGNRAHIFLYGLLCYPLVMQFFQDQYFNLLSTWIQYLCIYIVFSLLTRRVTFRAWRGRHVFRA